MEVIWKHNELIDMYTQIQYRLNSSKATWLTDKQMYNNSISHAVISNLENSQIYRFRLIAFDLNGKQIALSSPKRFALRAVNENGLPIPQITDAWITADGKIGIKWTINESTSEAIDGFIIYYRSLNSNDNYTKITIPNLVFPMIDTYTIPLIEFNTKYEIRMAAYSNRGLSLMSNSIELSIPECNLKFNLIKI